MSKIKVSGDYLLSLSSTSNLEKELEVKFEFNEEKYTERFPIDSNLPHKRMIWLKENVQVTVIVPEKSQIKWTLEFSRERIEGKNIYLINTKRSWYCSSSSCHYGFATKEGLVDHIKHKHRKIEAKLNEENDKEFFPFQCNDCNKSFKKEFDLNQHISKKKHFYCEKCFKFFKTQKGLQDHTWNVHPLCSEFVPYPTSSHKFCAICGLLKTHQHCQPNKTPHFICPVCVNKKFKLSSGLKKHIIDVHGGGISPQNDPTLELKNQKKARLTTLAIIPPNEVWPEIQKIRSQHDRQINRWMPHINMIYPFYEESTFPIIDRKLSIALSDVEPFEIGFHSFHCFGVRNEFVVWLRPDAGSKLHELSKILNEGCEISNKKYQQYHLTVGQFPTLELANAFIKEISENWVSIRFKVTKVQLMSRTDDTPFEIKNEIHFRQENILSQKAPEKTNNSNNIKKNTKDVKKKKIRNNKLKSDQENPPFKQYTKQELGRLSKLSTLAGSIYPRIKQPFDHERLETLIFKTMRFTRYSYRRRRVNKKVRTNPEKEALIRRKKFKNKLQRLKRCK